MSKHPTLIIIIALLLILIGGAGTVLSIWQNNQKDRVSPGIVVGDLTIGNLNLDQAKSALAQRVEKYNQQEIVLSFSGRQWHFQPAELGFIADIEQTFNQIANFDQTEDHLFSRLIQEIKTQIRSWFFPTRLALSFDFDQDKFDQVLANLADVEKPAQNAKLSYNPKTDSLLVLPDSAGLKIDRNALQKELANNISRLSPASINLVLIPDLPQVSAQNLEALKNQAKQILDQAPYFIKFGDATWTVDKTELAQWFTALPDSDQLTLDQTAIKDWLAQITPAINQEPIDAKLTIFDDQVQILIPDRPGTQLALEASRQKITERIMTGEKNIELVVSSTEPTVNAGNLNAFGLTSRLGLGESNFTGSPVNRQKNIALASTKLNAFLIKPGEEFSFAKSIGPIDEANGWLPELVIKDKKTVPDFGGGICQVSTTLFRAALNAGLKITERHPHAYPVRYYNPQGFDATVYPPHPDLRFLNDTPNYILLQDKIQGNKLIFEIYGTADGRQTKVIGPTITQSNPDGSLKTILTQEVWRDGALVRQDIFRSNYNSPNLYPHPAVSPSPTPTPSISPKPTG